MTVSSQLTADLRKLVLRLEDDLRERLVQDDENLWRWREEHQGALDVQRTSSVWQAWRDDKITQAAVAWVLTTVFVRFAEDNALVRPVWISGPGVRRQEALDAQIAFFRAHPELTDREWLLEPVEYLKKLPSTADLVGEHSALWQVQPSGRMATEILEFWRQTDETGLPRFDLADTKLSTRFLGDLYQDLSDYAKKTFALLQTPEFVEEFILDHTLTPALAERPLEGFKLIDPTCGSGHFLLGAFARLTDAWANHAPGLDARARVQKALDSLHGVDLNPFAVAIARFRLTVEALQACNENSLELAPAFSFHLAAGDSLLHGQVQREFKFEGFDADSQLSGFAYVSEDLEQLRRILKPDQYDVVIGNPPYITVKDRTLNEAYRKLYATCKGTYALTVPFMERFFGLARQGTPSQPAGWTGQITSNSFMKRGFGSKLIEEFLSKQDLLRVIDCEGVWIPGHNMDGTPTVIIVGRRRRPVGSKVRTVLSKGLRENRAVGNSGKGEYWTSIIREIENPGFSNEWMDVVDLERDVLSKHPWSLSGGGAVVLLQQMNKTRRKLSDFLHGPVGGSIRAGSDDAFVRPRIFGKDRGPGLQLRPLVAGDSIRDWSCRIDSDIIFPYQGENLRPSAGSLITHLWPLRTVLAGRATFQGVMADAGLEWWEYMQFTRSTYATPLSITFAQIASHNHFSLDEGGNVFKETAPTIKLNHDADKNEYLSILGILNSSAVCFWLKEVCKAKGGAADRPWARTFQFSGANVENIPVPEDLPLQPSQMLSRLALLEAETSLQNVVPNAPTEARLLDSRTKSLSLRRQQIAWQEELDWFVYKSYGLIDESLTYRGSALPEVNLGERAFEIELARRIAGGSPDTGWFERHASNPRTEIPSCWPADYQELIGRRLEAIAAIPSIRFLEQPEFKRRWAAEPWDRQQERALRTWLLDRLETRSLWFDRQGRPSARSISQLADVISRDEEFLSVLALWDGVRDVNVVKALTQLLTNEAVPYLAAQRLQDSGLRKFEAWEDTWEMQRREDSGEDVGAIAVPPKYAAADFRKASWWQARGKLDVPKERFILYPDADRSTDQSLLLGWAGWNHVEQFLALAAVMDQLVADGAPDEQLIPLVAGMGEILPWVKQWHADIDPAYGVSMADFCTQQFEERAAQVDRSYAQLKAWRPTTPARGRRTKVAQ